MSVILVVEDHDDTRKLLQKLLTGWGYEARGTASGEAALALLATLKPDLIIVDGMMPGMNGAEFIRLIRADKATAVIPAVMYTAIAEREFALNAIDKGANEVWHKVEMDIQVMRQRIASYIG